MPVPAVSISILNEVRWQWTEPELCLILHCVDSAGVWLFVVLLDEAVDKWTKDDSQNHTAAEDHHLFLEVKKKKDTDTKRKGILSYHLKT